MGLVFMGVSFNGPGRASSKQITAEGKSRACEKEGQDCNEFRPAQKVRPSAQYNANDLTKPRILKLARAIR
jgi:hypothetical protein